jgi:hypothetical protein
MADQGIGNKPVMPNAAQMHDPMHGFPCMMMYAPKVGVLNGMWFRCGLVAGDPSADEAPHQALV